MRIPHALRAVLLLGWMGFIFYMSAQPDSGEESGFFLRLLLGPWAAHLAPSHYEAIHHLVRKVAHFSEYAVLALILSWNLGTTAARLALSWALASAYAATDEWHQAFVPNRGPAVADVAVDSLGALAMVAFIMFWVHNRSRVARPAVPGTLPGVPANRPGDRQAD